MDSESVHLIIMDNKTSFTFVALLVKEGEVCFLDRGF